MKTIPVSSSMSNSSTCSFGLLLMQSYGYRLVACLVLIFVSMQFLLNFSSYHHRLVSISELQQQQQADALPFKDHRKTIPNSFLLEDMEQKRLNSISRGYLSRSDYVYAAANPHEMTSASSLTDTQRKIAVADAAAATTNASVTILVSNRNGSSLSNSSQQLTQCPAIPPALVGRLKVLLDTPSHAELETLYPYIEPGGRFRPKDCIPRSRVAIIIPYRDRDDHLRAFLHNIHPVLSRQQIDYGIFVIEEIAEVKFNRAKLMNIGFKEALKFYDYQCFIFHDVDLLPEDDRNLYTCPDQPRHMSVAVDTLNYRLPYKDIFGGVSALTKDQMNKVNGFSNEFWGWGGEDDDMANRVRFYGFRITRYRGEIARYHMMRHKKDTPNPDRYKILYKGRQRYKSDGLNTLHYKVVRYELRKLYTWILVDPLFNTNS